MAQEIEFEGQVAKVVIDSDTDGIRHQITIKTDVEWVGREAAAFVGKGKYVRVRLRKDWWEQPGLFDGEASANGAEPEGEVSAQADACGTCQGLGHVQGHGESCESLWHADGLTGGCTCGGVDVLCPACNGTGRVAVASLEGKREHGESEIAPLAEVRA